MKRFYYDTNNFYLDDKKFIIRSGAIHYFRVPKIYWLDRLTKLKECGLNCVETYLPWNLHQPKEDEFIFSDNLDFVEFINLANSLNLFVIVRPGPYICAEWENGGLPYWLKNYADIKIRSSQKTYLDKLTPYLTVVANKVKPLLVENGGNVLMIQIENEYGSYGNDYKYLNYIKNLYSTLIPECTLFTADGYCNQAQSNGSLEGVLATVNVGSSFNKVMPWLKRKFPYQPLCCMEFWCGWFDHWNGKHTKRRVNEKLKCVKYLLKKGYSFNIYMFHGGTNFGFMNGANFIEETGEYQPTVTSYDYDAFLSESGDRTKAYYKLKRLIKKYVKVKMPDTATDSVKKAYGKIKFTKSCELFGNLRALGKPIIDKMPKSMQQLGQDYGYVYYKTNLSNENFKIKVNDRANVFINGQNFDVYYRKNDSEYSITNQVGDLEILVENCGRINYGERSFDDKGIFEISGNAPICWESLSLPMNNLFNLPFENITTTLTKSPCFYKGEFSVDIECDTYLVLTGFSKGFVLINGFNVGRYWNVPPQSTLYIPKNLLIKGINQVIVFDSDGAKELNAEFIDHPINR